MHALFYPHILDCPQRKRDTNSRRCAFLPLGLFSSIPDHLILLNGKQFRTCKLRKLLLQKKRLLAFVTCFAFLNKQWNTQRKFCVKGIYCSVVSCKDLLLIFCTWIKPVVQGQKDNSKKISTEKKKKKAFSLGQGLIHVLRSETKPPLCLSSWPLLACNANHD